MSLHCTSPQGRTRRACLCPLNPCTLTLRPLLVPRQLGVMVGQQSLGVRRTSCLPGTTQPSSNCFPRAVQSHPVHPPGCLAWIEAWAFSPLQTFSICCSAEDGPKFIAATAGPPPGRGWGAPGWGAIRRWGTDMGTSLEMLHAGLPEPGPGALCPAPAQCWCLPCNFLLLSLPALPGPTFPGLQQSDGTPPSSWHACVSPTPSRSTRDPSPSLRGVLLTVCLLSPRSQDSCSQDSSTEMVGCSARLMPGFSFSWRCFSACSAPSTWVHHLPGVWVPQRAAVTKGSLVAKSALALPSWF